MVCTWSNPYPSWFFCSSFSKKQVHLEMEPMIPLSCKMFRRRLVTIKKKKNLNYIIKKYQKILSCRKIVLDSFFTKKNDASYFKVYMKAQLIFLWNKTKIFFLPRFDFFVWFRNWVNNRWLNVTCRTIAVDSFLLQKLHDFDICQFEIRQIK